MRLISRVMDEASQEQDTQLGSLIHSSEDEHDAENMGERNLAQIYLDQDGSQGFAIACIGTKSYTLRRNNEGKLRLLDKDGNPPSQSVGNRRESPLGDNNNRPSKRPRREIYASEESSNDDCEPNDVTENESDDAVEGLSYWDEYEEVTRCVFCKWEMWRPTGYCTGCGQGMLLCFV
jgi:hypothetical protein